MNIQNHAPAARGVNQLMYVGDAHAVEPPFTISLVAIVAVGLLGWFLFGGR